MAISAGGPAGEGHPSWGRDIRLRGDYHTRLNAI